MLSICMIVKDGAAAGLSRCLASAGLCADEIVLVDTGSSDNTKEIAVEHGAMVYDFEWVNDFAAARNFSISKATKPWILWLDADDELPEETISVVNRLKTSHKYAAIWLRLNNVNTTHSDIVSDDSIGAPEQIRMFPNYIGLKFVNNHYGVLHESVGQDIEYVGPETIEMWINSGLSILHHESGHPAILRAIHRPECVTHHGYDNPATLDSKVDRNIKLLMRGLGFNTDHQMVWFRIGDYRCTYMPNTLIVWSKVGRVIAVSQPIKSAPENLEDARDLLMESAVDMINEYEKNTGRSMSPMDVMQHAINLMEIESERLSV
jgi:glycosyltransferase involved in cell wall biosynthesis